VNIPNLIDRFVEKINRAFYFLFVVVVCAGCSHNHRFAIDGLPDHPKRVVRYPAKVGGVLGCIVGVPLTIIMLPITMTIVERKNGPVENQFLILMPVSVSCEVGILCVGGPSWLVFGWWGKNDQSLNKHVDNPIDGIERVKTDDVPEDGTD
jgi:hypothetical protein